MLTFCCIHTANSHTINSLLHYIEVNACTTRNTQQKSIHRKYTSIEKALMNGSIFELDGYDMPYTIHFRNWALFSLWLTSKNVVPFLSSHMHFHLFHFTTFHFSLHSTISSFFTFELIFFTHSYFVLTILHRLYDMVVVLLVLFRYFFFHFF